MNLDTALEEIISGRSCRHWFSKLDSPAEDQFAWKFAARVAEDWTIHPQSECRTNHGKFRLDFAVQSGTDAVGYECDGAKFHDAERDRIRDAAIVESGIVRVIYRIKAADIWYRNDDVFDVLAWLEPDVFRVHANHIERYNPKLWMYCVTCSHQNESEEDCRSGIPIPKLEITFTGTPTVEQGRNVR